jgi:ribosomal protein S4E
MASICGPTQFPRVNHELLSRFIGKTVNLTGKVVTRQPNGSVILETSDGKNVTIQTSRANEYDAFVEVLGKVSTEQTVVEIQFTNLISSFGL